MKKYFKNLNFEKFAESIVGVVKRFPLPIILILTVASLLCSLIAGVNDSKVLITNVILSGIVTFFLSIGVYLIAESYWDDKLRKNIFQIIALAFGIGLFYYLNTYANSADKQQPESMYSVLAVILSLIAFLSFLFVAPYVRRIFQRRYDQEAYHGYFYRISLTFLVSAIVGWALMALWSIAIWSTIFLFDLSKSLFVEDFFAYWAVISLSVVSPVFWLSHLPKKSDFEQKKVPANAFFTFLVKYVGTPFIYIYFLILYAYSIKVLQNVSMWPKGQISWMVIGFSVFGYIVYIFTQSLEKNVFIGIFRKYFPLAVLPQTLMLFYAIYLRIQQYDLTVDRYFVVVFGIWLVGISIYFALSKSKYLGMIPLSISIVICIISFGPWSIFQLPEARQYERLISNLNQARILRNGIIYPLENPKGISAELAKEISGELSYLCDYSNCEKVRTLFQKELESSHEKLNTKWQILSVLSEKLNLNAGTYGAFGEINRPYYTIRVNFSDNFFPIPLGDYQYIASISTNNDVRTAVSPARKDAVRVAIDSESKTLSVYKDEKIVETVSIEEFIKRLSSHGNGRDMFLGKDELTFSVSGNLYDVKLFVTSIGISSSQNKNNSRSLLPVDGYALIRLK